MNQLNATALDGGCYVVSPEGLSLSTHGGLRWARIIGAPEGARRLAQFVLEAQDATSPVIDSTEHDTVLFILAGHCTVQISGREFDAGPRTGIHVRRGEAFRIAPANDRVRCLMTCCPGVDELRFLESMPESFDPAFPVRTVAEDDNARQATGDRFFQVLVGPDIGSTEVTQFIGMIPRSRAPEHFHLYEEAICVLRGSGRMWAGESQAPVGPGSMVFLPTEQPHCMECEDADGMELVGIFYPAGSPAVNYATD